jgi:hypothetical protein
MIKNKSVFIVGAGASKDLGLPTGKELKTSIRDLLKRTRHGGGTSLSITPPKSAVFDALQSDPRFRGDSESLGQLLDLIASNMGDNSTSVGSATSIDAFLDNHRNDDRVVKIGKLAIADAIAVAEAKCILGSPQVAGSASSNDYFLDAVLNLAVAGHTHDTVLESLKNLSFVTFNYDRCIERYADLWLLKRFNGHLKPDARKLNVVHIYGSLADYNPGEKFSVQTSEHKQRFWANPHLDIAPVADRLKIFTESIDNKIQSSIDAACAEAHIVIFLGFAFEKQNMDFFRKSTWGWPVNEGPNIGVFATTFGIRPTNVASIKNLISGKFHQDLHSVEMTNGKFIDLWEGHNYKIREGAGAYS